MSRGWRRFVYGFDFHYRSRPNWTTYAELLDLAALVRLDQRDLGPRDFIDAQSFLWVQGSEEWLPASADDESDRPQGASIVISAGFGPPYASAIARRRRMAPGGARVARALGVASLQCGANVYPRTQCQVNRTAVCNSEWPGARRLKSSPPSLALSAHR